MKLHLCLFSILFCLQVNAQNMSNHSEPLMQIQRERYSLSYPGSWALDTSKIFGMDLLLRSPRVDSLDLFIENLNVFVQELHGQDYTLLKMGQESEDQIKNMVTDVEIIESRLDSSGSNIYYSLKYKGRHGKFNLITEQRYYLMDDVGFALTFTVQIDKESAYAQVSRRILDSFKLF